MAAWHAATPAAIVLTSLFWGAGPCLGGPETADETGAPTTLQPDMSPSNRSFHPPPDPLGYTRPSLFERRSQHQREIKALRQQRRLELEAIRKARKADRTAWLRRWKEQRQRAREQTLERERSYRRELNQRFPALSAHRKRYAGELERRRQAFEQERRERWRALDDLED